MNMKVQLIGIALIVFSVFCAVVHAAHLAEFFIVGLVSAILGLILCFVGLCMTGSKEEDKEKKADNNKLGQASKNNNENNVK